uniref:Uncharacterized protein n=1 Tax=Timema bartmani TaxID=61472 RepID=A0A7R9F4A4_9NEOP|nr:unnamed protein product [Timema bartmani]
MTIRGLEADPEHEMCAQHVLNHLAQSLTLAKFSWIFPPASKDEYQHYRLICQQVGHANQIRSLVMTTGQQLLSALDKILTHRKTLSMHR